MSRGLGLTLSWRYVASSPRLGRCEVDSSPRLGRCEVDRAARWGRHCVPHVVRDVLTLTTAGAVLLSLLLGSGRGGAPRFLDRPLGRGGATQGNLSHRRVGHCKAVTI